MSSSSGKDNTTMKSRTSSRVRTLSKSMRLVDDETRKEHRNMRLLMLEADNYVEGRSQEGEDENDEDFAEVEKEDHKKSHKRKHSKNLLSSMSTTKWNQKKVKSLERIIFEQGYNMSTNKNTNLSVNYLDVAAGPSICPARQLCAVCGGLGKYKCTRCGSRFCTKRCDAHHKETRCMKFSI